MRTISCTIVLAALCCLVFAIQQPLVQPGIFAEKVPWDAPPDPDNTGHLIFNGVVNLLRHWSNTYHRNGHTVVPLTVNPSTLFYHGRDDDVPPTSGEFLANNAEHALLFTKSNNSGYLFTYAATRPLQLLYFDGSSGYNLPTGPSDTQDVTVFGNVTWVFNPFERLGQLCDWGKDYGLDGFLRMEYDFEVLYCNFTDGLKLVSRINVVPYHPSTDNYASLNDTDGPNIPGCPGCKIGIPPEPPKGWEGSLLSGSQALFESLHSGSWHQFSPVHGMKPDYASLLTFYNPKYESLVKARREISTSAAYRLLNISNEDGAMYKRELEDVLMRRRGEGSGIDWGSVMSSIVERYSDRLDYLRRILRSTATTVSAQHSANLTTLVRDARQQVLVMLAPHLSRADMPPSGDGTLQNRTWLEPAIKSCSGHYTKHMNMSTFTSQEHILKSATEATAKEICRTLGLIWTTALGAESAASPSAQEALLAEWSTHLDRLMGWLDWSEWVKCEPACNEDEICLLRQWPWDGVLYGDEAPTPPHCVSRSHWVSPLPPPA